MRLLLYARVRRHRWKVPLLFKLLLIRTLYRRWLLAAALHRSHSVWVALAWLLLPRQSLTLPMVVWRCVLLVACPSLRL
jgi:hypothetical protein